MRCVSHEKRKVEEAGVGDPSFKQKMGYGKMGFPKDGKSGNDGKDGFQKMGSEKWKRWVKNIKIFAKTHFSHLLNQKMGSGKLG